jgi:hypothetical protein
MIVRDAEVVHLPERLTRCILSGPHAGTQDQREGEAEQKARPCAGSATDDATCRPLRKSISRPNTVEGAVSGPFKDRAADNTGNCHSRSRTKNTTEGA